jgi:hypothetical protein
MQLRRNRLFYLLTIIVVIVLGLGSRKFSYFFPGWVSLYLGDILWGLMVFLLSGFVFARKSGFFVSAAAGIFSISIEVSQLYHSVWIDTIRDTRIGGLVLGYGFLWSDIFSYIIGILLGFMAEKVIYVSLNHK